MARAADEPTTLLDADRACSRVFGMLFATLRKAAGQTQFQYAKRLGWNRSVLTRLESGRNIVHVFHVHELEKIARIEGQIDKHGDFMELAGRVFRQHRNFADRLDDASLERVMGAAVEDWLKSRRTT